MERAKRATVSIRGTSEASPSEVYSAVPGFSVLTGAGCFEGERANRARVPVFSPRQDALQRTFFSEMI